MNETRNTREHKLRWKRAGPAGAVILAIVTPPLVLIPVQIHSDNIYDVAVGLADMLPWLLYLAAPVVAVGVGTLLALPAHGYRVTIALGTGLAVMVWLQGQVLVWEYGVLTGVSIDWWADWHRGLVDSLVWLLVIAVAIVARKAIAGRAGTIAVVLLLMHGVPALKSSLDQPKVPDFHRYSLDESTKFSYSPEQNVIVIILDAFQADIFLKLLDEDPVLEKDFAGFTFFRNAVSGFSKTYPSVTLMLTGQWYDNSTPIQEFIKDRFLDLSIPRELMRQGWQIDLYPHVKRVVHTSPSIASNAVPVIKCDVAAAETGKLVDLGMFRISPHWLKPLWLNGYRWQMGRHLTDWCARDAEIEAGDTPPTGDAVPDHFALRFLYRSRHESDTGSSSPTLKLYHQMIPHSPFLLDRELQLSALPADAEGYIEQSRAAISLITRFLDDLRRLDIYDSSVIAIVSDHGGGSYRPAVDTGLLDAAPRHGDDGQSNIPGKHLASGLPLILIKRANDQSALRISDAPVSLGDLARTLAEQLGLKNEFPGADMFDVSMDQQRTRPYYYYEFMNWTGEYLPRMIEYEASGFSWFSHNWRATGRVMAPPASDSKPHRPIYQVGGSVHFRPGSPYISGLLAGWSSPQSDGLVWSRSSNAEIEFLLGEEIMHPVVARFDFAPYTAGGAIESPRIEVVVNGEFQQQWTSRRRGWHQVRLPAELFHGSDLLRFEFHFPDASSPFSHGRSMDIRELGIALYNFEMEYVQ